MNGYITVVYPYNGLSLGNKEEVLIHVTIWR